jgi:hypothetical protein
MATTKTENVKETTDNKETIASSPKSTKKKGIVLEVQGRANRIYQVKINGEMTNVLKGERITVDTEDEADRLCKVDNLAGGFLFKKVNGGNE